MAAALTNDFVTDEDLQRFREKFETEEKNGQVSSDTQLQYGWCLIRSGYKSEIRKGIELLQELCTRGSDQRDFLFFLGQGYYKIGEYDMAMKCIQRLLMIEPNNNQGREMRDLIHSKMKKDGLMGAAVVGGAVLGGIVGIVGGSIILGYRLLKK